MKTTKPKYNPDTLPQDSQHVIWQTEDNETNGIWIEGNFCAETSITIPYFLQDGGNKYLVHQVTHWAPAPEITEE